MNIQKIKYILVGLLSIAILHAEELTPEQKQFRLNIMQFLKEEGFSPSIDEEDNSLNFKKEGELHWITLSDSNPFYLEFHKSGLTCENADRKIVIEAVNDGNRKVRCAKAILNEKTISFAIEMYCHSAEEFKYIFYKSLKELESIEETVSNYYNEHSKGTVSAPFTVSSVSIANADQNKNIITPYENKIYSYKTQYIQPKLYIDTKQAGIYDIFVKFYTPNGLSTASNGSSPTGYSYKNSITLSTGFDSYEMIGWGGSDSGHWTKGNYRIEFYYNGEIIAQKTFTIY